MNKVLICYHTFGFNYGKISNYSDSGLYCLLIVHDYLQSHSAWITQRISKKRKDNKPLPPLTSEDPHPMVTIQLPLFNEMFVVERLIDNIMKINYPKDKLEIQVLDDSTDDSVQLAINKVNHYKNLGYNIKHIHRTDRSGYKAGALKEGMKHAEGEFIAIFDADFLPEPDF